MNYRDDQSIIIPKVIAKYLSECQEPGQWEVLQRQEEGPLKLLPSGKLPSPALLPPLVCPPSCSESGHTVLGWKKVRIVPGGL